MAKNYKVGDTLYKFPDDFSDDKVQQILTEQGIIKSKKPLGDERATLGGVAKTMASQAGRALGAAGEVLNPKGLIDTALHPIDTAKAMFGATESAVERTRKAFNKKQYGEAAQSAVGAIPVVGPLAETMVREGVQGKYPELIGHAGALALGAKLPKALGKGAAKVLPKASRAIMEAELKPGMKPSIAARGEMVERTLKKGSELPIEEKSIGKLEQEASKNKAQVDALTKDPNSPYSGRSIPVADLLAPVDEYIKRVARVDKELEKTLAAKRATWAKSLGGGTDATVAQAQTLKEDLYSVINSGSYAEAAEPGTLIAGRKLAARGIKRGVERAIPEEPIRAINHTIEVDLKLKDAITSAIKRSPSWINDWGVFVLGAGAEQIFTGNHLTGGAAVIGALTRMAARNPRIMSRLSIALKKTGVAAPKIGEAVGKAAPATAIVGETEQKRATAP